MGVEAYRVNDGFGAGRTLPAGQRTNNRLEDLSPERSKELGRMLVAAVQLELFQLLDDICEAGDVDNELFDDLCCDTIQEGARDGFVHLTPELLLAPGSGYKRLLQIRKDQVSGEGEGNLYRLRRREDL